MQRKFFAVMLSVILCISMTICPVFGEQTKKVASQKTKPGETIETKQQENKEAVPISQDSGDIPGLEAKSSILMDAKSGNFVYEYNSNQRVPIASITKTMSMLLVMEAIAQKKITFETMVPVSVHAYDMGGSQVYLKPGEEFTVREMLKAVAIHSANDATVALAELVEGSEDVFVAKMNEKAKVLGMKDTHFVDATGLTDEGHFSSAHDIALMSRELIIKHPKITEYTSIWLDSFRNGKFMLTNTNLLVKSIGGEKAYRGALGIKTGFTDEAGYCLSAAATRKDVTLISVVLGLSSDEKRVRESAKVLDYGFINFNNEVVSNKGTSVGMTRVNKGIGFEVEGIIGQDVKALVKKKEISKIVRNVKFDENLMAPLEANAKIGEATYTVDNKPIAKVAIVAKDKIDKASWMRLFWRMVFGWFGIKY